jgi:hypothetical protein
MNENRTEFDLTVEKTAENLWNEFEKTGSVQAYLQFIRSSEKNEEVTPAHLSL